MASRRRVRGLIVALLTLPGFALAAPVLATREAGQTVLRSVGRESLQALPATAAPETPLGSVWKLFVYGYLVEQGIQSPDYQCRGNDREEVYCCEPGGHIDREEALVRSCGRYFEPQRLGLKSADWRRFWQERKAPQWLADLARLREDTKLPVSSLLDALEIMPDEARRQASQSLIGVLTRPNAEGLVVPYGGLLRAKTWTMPDPRHAGMRIGGAAGWFANSQPFWLGGQGSGVMVLRQAAPALAEHIASQSMPDDAHCVEVRYFDRYPLRRVLRLPDGRPAVAGPLNGQFRAVFVRGNSLDFSAGGELRLEQENGQPVVRGHLGLNDYVARVVEREGGAEPQAAAQALAIAARSYLAQQAERRAGCYQIRDSSATQRVAPRPASRASARIARWSTDLVLRGVPVRYHFDRQAPGVLSWLEAKQRAARGESFERILATAFPGASLGGIDARQRDDCLPAPEAQRWLGKNVPHWRRRLQGEVGYTEPTRLPVVCMASSERPFADTERHRLHVRGWITQEDRIALAHEYLHLAFEGHPRAQDEAGIERLARQLIMETY